MRPGSMRKADTTTRCGVQNAERAGLTPAQILAKHVALDSDIAGHLQFMHDLVVDMDARVVVELGVWTGQSTVALLCALAQTGGLLISCDIKDFPDTRKMIADYRLGVPWAFDVADDLVWGADWEGDGAAQIEVLLIDSSHQRAQTEAELRLFSRHMRRDGVILLHDTTAPEWSANIMGAIAAFRADFPGWQFENREHCNGLGILKNSSERK